MRPTLSPLVAFALLALAPAAAFAADGAAVPSTHQGLAFAASKTARARIVEPDGRVLVIDSVSDLVAPSSIAERQAKTAIVQLIRAAVPAKAAKPATDPPGKLQEP